MNYMDSIENIDDKKQAAGHFLFKTVNLCKFDKEKKRQSPFLNEGADIFSFIIENYPLSKIDKSKFYAFIKGAKEKKLSPYALLVVSPKDYEIEKLFESDEDTHITILKADEEYKTIKNELYVRERYEYTLFEENIIVHKTVNEKIRHNNAWIVYDKDYAKKTLNLKGEKEIYNYIWSEIKEINKTMPQYKHIKKLYISDEEMIKTSWEEKMKRYKKIIRVVLLMALCVCAFSWTCRP